jgi:hypothetical protein
VHPAVVCIPRGRERLRHRQQRVVPLHDQADAQHVAGPQGLPGQGPGGIIIVLAGELAA